MKCSDCGGEHGPRNDFHTDAWLTCLVAVRAQRDEARQALTKIDAIRNSIVGAQTINWSEHIYPLVAALDAAGFVGKPYPESREYVGTLIARADLAERRLAIAVEALRGLAVRPGFAPQETAKVALAAIEQTSAPDKEGAPPEYVEYARLRKGAP